MYQRLKSSDEETETSYNLKGYIFQAKKDTFKYILLIGDFSAKLSKKKSRESCVG